MVDKSEKFTWLVRGGFAVRGLVYLLVGYLALSSVEAARGGAEAAFDVLQQIPLGRIVLYTSAVGLLAYAAFKLLSAVSDVERHGSDWKGMAKRTGFFASALAHTVLAWTAFQFAGGDKHAAEGSRGGEQQAATLLSWDMGGAILTLIGLGLILAAAIQARDAYTAHFMRDVGRDAPGAICWIGRAGHAARAMVFLIVGWSLVRSGLGTNSADVKGLGEAIVSLHENSTLYNMVAIGLVMFGLFSMVVAWFRIIPDIDASDVKPGL